MKIASPLPQVAAMGGAKADAEAVVSACREFDVDAFVVGLPLNMDDTEGKQAKVTRGFGDALAAASGLPVHYQDERLSTVAADDAMMPAELTRKKKKARRDSVAAQILLQEFLDTHSTDSA